MAPADLRLLLEPGLREMIQVLQRNKRLPEHGSFSPRTLRRFISSRAQIQCRPLAGPFPVLSVPLTLGFLLSALLLQRFIMAIGLHGVQQHRESIGQGLKEFDAGGLRPKVQSGEEAGGGQGWAFSSQRFTQA